MVGLIRSVYRYTYISSLFRSQLGQFHTDLFEMQAGNFFVQMLRKTIYIDFLFLVELLNLSQCLIGK